MPLFREVLQFGRGEQVRGELKARRQRGAAGPVRSCSRRSGLAARV